MIELLEATREYVKNFIGIRISTRPDCIDEKILEVLKKYNVTAIELGAQSMDDEVLKLNERGHCASDVKKAGELIKSYGFSLGLQMMTGLYGSDFYKDIYTADEFIKIRPDTVRIYPTITMKDTELANLYIQKKYIPYSLEESVNLCAKLILKFEQEKIKIIRLGLHYSESLITNSYGNNYHPAFKELCENKIFADKLVELLKNTDCKNFDVFVNPKSVSKLMGQKRKNIAMFEKDGYNLKVKNDSNLGKYEIYINESL